MSGSSRKDILLLSPFHGTSSHAAWADGLLAHSRHRYHLVALEDKAWSWRLKGSSVPLWEKLQDISEPVDLVLATSLTPLDGLFGLLRRSKLARVPVVCYMHENQLAYPIRPGGTRDPSLVLHQFHSQLVADEIWFNSEYNRASWFKKLPVFLRKFKDHQGVHLIERLKERSRVVGLGLTLPRPEAIREVGERPLLLWNQRWVWEKGIDRFVGLIKKFDQDAAFDVVLLGREIPDPLRIELEEYLGPRLLHAGWCERDEYEEWLQKASLSVSVARHEFFGISLMEAAARGVMLFLPEALSYPHLLPSELHEVCLYRSAKSLYRKVKAFLQSPNDYSATRKKLQDTAWILRWEEQVTSYDHLLERVTASGIS